MPVNLKMNFLIFFLLGDTLILMTSIVAAPLELTGVTPRKTKPRKIDQPQHRYGESSQMGSTSMVQILTLN